MNLISDKPNKNRYITQATWAHEELHPLDLIKDKQWDLLWEYAEDNQELLIHRFLQGERSGLADSVENGSFFLNITEDRLKKRKRDGAIFSLGKAKGILIFLSRILGNEAQAKRIENIAESRLSGIKNLDEIIRILEREGTLTHSELAEKMNGMNPPTLTENMKKISAYGLIRTQVSGKYKYYSLSDAGRSYAYTLRKRTTPSGDISELRKRLEFLIKDSRSRSQTITMMRQLLEEADEFSHVTAFIPKDDYSMEISKKSSSVSRHMETNRGRFYRFGLKSSIMTNKISSDINDHKSVFQAIL